MKTLDLNQMGKITGSGKCEDYIYANSSYTAYDACVICAGVGGAAAGIFGGGPGILAGWLGGSIAGLFTC